MAHTLSRTRLLALAALIALAALAAAALLTLAPARADSHNNQLILELLDDSDNIVPPGSEITIRATLRFSGELSGDQIYQLSNSALTLSGSFDWDESAGSRLAPPNFDTGQGDLPSGGRIAMEILSPTRADGTSVGNTGRIIASGLHARTLIATSNLGEAYLFDAFARRQVAVIPAPDLPGAEPLSFGRPGQAFESHSNADGAAAWQESEKIAWLFIASSNDDIEGVADVGSLYIYKVDWSRNPVDVQMVKRLVPPSSEFANKFRTSATQYGSSVEISGDGSTLAVGARRMNELGAVYIYTRPEGGGVSWGDLEYADGVKLTVAATPAWGDPADTNTRPFDHTSQANCNSWCRAVSRVVHTTDANFAFPEIGLSYDGEVLAVGADGVCHAVEANLPQGGSFGCTGLSQPNQGVVFVFVAPDGGWQEAPRAAYDSDGNAKALVRAGEDATGFDPDTHYAPGPARYATANATLLRRLGGGNDNEHFGRALAVSGDGLTIAINRPKRSQVNIYQRNARSDWTGSITRTRWLEDVEVVAWLRGGGLAFNRDGSVLLVGNPRDRETAVAPATDRAGSLDIWRRVDGERSWGSSRYDRGPWPPGTNPPAMVKGTTVVNQGYFGAKPIWDLEFARYAFSRPIHTPNANNAGQLSGFYLSDGHNCLPTVFEDGTRGVNCVLAIDNVEIPPGTEVQKLTVAGSVRLGVQGSEDEPEVIRAEPLIITVDEVQELAELKLDRATDDQGTPNDPDDDVLYPAAIARGESTTLRLQVLNENGKASARNSISVVNVTTSAGALSSALGCRGGGSALTCIIEGSALNAGNADKVLITLRHGGTAAAANISANAVSVAGDTAAVGPLTIILTGPPASLAIAEPPGGLLGVDTTDTGEDIDNRDVVTLAVTAADALGGKVAVPASGVSAWLSDPVGARVASGVEITWPLLGADGEPALDPDRNQQVRVNVNRAAGQALRSGEYTLTVRAGGLTATRTLAISGDAATVALSEPTPAPALNGQFTVTAVVADESGAAVPNGTSVRWAAESLLESTSLVQLTADRITSDGEASATYLVVAPGRTSVRATVGNVSNVHLVEIADTSAPTAPLTVAEQLTHTALNRPVSWLGEGTVTASALLAAVEGATTVQLWQYGRWIRYGVSEGREIPGSFNFIAENGAVLWFSK